ncbi:MAG: two-component regulator propeller domain-containing protein [Bacteroidota bacterium]|nr:two-component regulator propeller domain-containing protein [Bacteroidota bacterium]
MKKLVRPFISIFEFQLIKLKTYLFICCALSIFHSFAQTYNFKNYNTEHGLPQSQVLSIFQDSKGYVWFGTNSGGVGKFDGNKFYQLSANDGLINDVVFSIAETPNHEMLFGTSKGISVYKNLSFTNYNEKNGLSSSWVFKLLNDKNKTWIGTQKGVFVLANNKITAFTNNEMLNNSAVYSMFIDANDNIWFGTMQNGLIYYDRKNETFTHLTSANGLSHDFIFSFEQRSNGEVLVGTQTGLNIVDKNMKVRQVNEIPAQGNISFSSIIKTGEDEFYFSTFAEGIFSYNFTSKKKKGYYNSGNGLTSNPILALLQDREKNIWIGSNGSGVYKFFSNKFIYYTKLNGLSENYINTVSEDKNGNIWLALNSHGLAKINNGAITSYQRGEKNSAGLIDNNINAILPMDDGTMYFGTDEGLYHFENGKFLTLSDPLIKDGYISSLYLDSKNKIWIGTNNGVFTLKDGVVTEETKVNSIGGKGIHVLILFVSEDKFGRILIGTENGVVEYDGSKVVQYNDKNKFISARVSCAVIDSRKNIWLGTSDGLYLYNYSVFTRISKKQGYTSGFINFLQIDSEDHLYIGSNNGIDVIDIKAFYHNEAKIKHFGKDDGLLSLESNSNAGYIAKDSRILIGTVGGLEIYDPNIDPVNTKEPLLNITDVKLFFGQENILDHAKGIDSINYLPKELVLPSSKNNITFKYIGISLIAPEKVVYKYKLEGLDNSWTPEISKTEVTYPSLPPGSYTFMVSAMNNDGLWNKQPSTYSFVILPPWYQTWWFYTICIISCVGGVFAYNTIKTKKLIADKQKLEKQVEERTKEVVKQKEEIQNKNVEITDSIKYAKNIQEALLPSLKETETALKNCFILYQPKDIVSGDFFWHSDHNNIQFIAAADCTGHGVPGAFMSIVGNNLLNEIINQRNITEPGKILLELHKGVKIALNQNHHESERRDGMDIALCAIDKKTNKLKYSGANRPLWIFRKDNGNQLEIIKPNKFPIGGLELEGNREYIDHSVEVKKGDTVFIFSDGFADQFGGPRGKKFMLANMQKLLLENIEQPMDVQKKNVSNAFRDWKHSLEQIDDVLVIGIRV